MKSKTGFELFRWTYWVLLWLIGLTLIMIIGEFAAGPALRWLLYDVPYQFPTWHRMGRIVLFVVFAGFFIGTMTWFYEKKSYGR